MDAIRTLLLARTHVVVLDPDRVASAATRPSRDADVDRFEDELAQLGFVMSLDLAITIRRLPNLAIRELRDWMIATLAPTLGARRPHVPLYRALPAGTPGDTPSAYLRRVLTWLSTRAAQPCPWCGQVRTVGALDPCGHLVCRGCWEGGRFAGCPICHRRVPIGAPFLAPGPAPETERVAHHDGELRLLHLAFDLAGTARARFESLLTRPTPLSRDDRAEIETMIDALGPKAVAWLPRRIPIQESMAIAIARIWLVSPDRLAVMRATAHHLRTATDVLRVALVLMGRDPDLAARGRLGAIPRGLRRTVLEALDQLAPDALVEDVARHAGLWKRVGERLHPFEHAARLPTAALAFAVVRGTSVARTSLGPMLQAQATQLARVRIEDDRVRVTSWAGAVEDGLRARDPLAVAACLAGRPGELLRRADHLVRISQEQQPEALASVVRTIQDAVTRGAPGTLLTLASHLARRDHAWSRRVMFPGGEVLRAWRLPDQRPPLRAAAITAIVDAIRAELVARAQARRHVPRAVIDRALGDLVVPISRLRWLDVHRHDPAAASPRTSGPRAPLARITTSVAELLATGARPTLWEVACIHAAGRANLVYVRERDGRITQIRRRDGETVAGRLARLLAGDDADGTLAAIPPADAPTWLAVVRDDLAIPAGSEGYVLDARTAVVPALTRFTAAELIAQLASRPG